ncbi:MAG: SAM-dependent methyltransferase [Opitutaceae bacterium]|nr:SAM-dependent methyltransferase [Opitutaceae bacterium]
MSLALYHPEVGYYRRPGERVGYAPGTDFFTASTSGAVFGELVAAACAKLLRAAGRDPAAHAFVEIGAEPGSAGVLHGVKHPFAAARVVRGADQEPPPIAGECVLFSNELFDAQPFIRAVSHGGHWRPIGVRLEGERLVEVLQADGLDRFAPPLAEGYRFDAPMAATGLCEAIVSPPWRGLFVAIDYGKSERELLQHTPAGTARAYWRHTQHNDLLARPGEQDLTCHVCWDWLMGVLDRTGFSHTALESQEAFFIRHAGDYIAAASVADAATVTPRKRSLQQLLHPAHLGQKFQVLHGLR